MFAHGANASSADRLVASIATSDGTTTAVLTKTGAATDVDGVWRNVSIPVGTWNGQTIRIVLQAEDGAANSLVEAQIEDVRITRGS